MTSTTGGNRELDSLPLIALLAVTGEKSVNLTLHSAVPVVLLCVQDEQKYQRLLPLSLEHISRSQAHSRAKGNYVGFAAAWPIFVESGVDL